MCMRCIHESNFNVYAALYGFTVSSTYAYMLTQRKIGPVLRDSHTLVVKQHEVGGDAARAPRTVAAAKADAVHQALPFLSAAVVARCGVRDVEEAQGLIR